MLPARNPGVESHTPKLQVWLECPALCRQRTWVLEEREGLA